MSKCSNPLERSDLYNSKRDKILREYSTGQANNPTGPLGKTLAVMAALCTSGAVVAASDLGPKDLKDISKMLKGLDLGSSSVYDTPGMDATPTIENNYGGLLETPNKLYKKPFGGTKGGYNAKKARSDALVNYEEPMNPLAKAISLLGCGANAADSSFVYGEDAAGIKFSYESLVTPIKDPTIPPGIPTEGFSILTNDPDAIIHGPLLEVNETKKSWVYVDSGENLTLLKDGMPVEYYENLSKTVFLSVNYQGNKTIVSFPVDEKMIILKEIAKVKGYRDYVKSKFGGNINPTQAYGDEGELTINGPWVTMPDGGSRYYAELDPKNPHAKLVDGSLKDILAHLGNIMLPYEDGKIVVDPKRNMIVPSDGLC